MNIIWRGLTACSLVLSLASCESPLPETYGVYATTDRGLQRLESHSTIVTGTFLAPIAGLEKPSGTACESLDSFTVYWKDVVPNAIQLSRLEIGGHSAVGKAANLWIPKENIELDVRPVKGHADMYMAHRSPLPGGFYALHLGAFGSDIPWASGEVYDIVMGPIEKYPSYEEMLLNRDCSLRESASRLLKRMNEMFNSGDYSRLAETYRPNGKVLSGAELQRFLEGTKLWRSTAGRIESSYIGDIAITNGGTFVQCKVTTRYERAGEKEESMEVKRIGEEFFVTLMR